MVFHQVSEKTRLRRSRTNEAIALAMQSRWEEAVQVNQSLIEMFPDDADAYNRLGKALTQLGRYSEARDAYSRAVDIEPNNGIARKNLERLAHIADEVAEPKTVRPVSSHLFIEEIGKAAVADLHRVAPSEVLARMAAGDPVSLKARGQSLIVESMEGEHVGEVEPRLGARLVRLMEGGNRYSAAIASIGSDRGRVLIKEVFQHPSQAGRASFPARAADDFRSYVKDTLLKYEREEEEEMIEEEYPGEWEKEDATVHENVNVFEGIGVGSEEGEEEELNE